MINTVRVDHRLVHGQVVYSWVGSLDNDTIFVINDDVPTNEIRKNTIRLAKPAGVKLVMKSIDDAISLINSGVTDKYKMMIVLETVQDACKLIKGTGDKIQSLNLGGTKMLEGTKQFFNQIYLSQEDVKSLNELLDKGVEVEARMVPKEEKKLYKKQ